MFTIILRIYTAEPILGVRHCWRLPGSTLPQVSSSSVPSFVSLCPSSSWTPLPTPVSSRACSLLLLPTGTDGVLLHGGAEGTVYNTSAPASLPPPALAVLNHWWVVVGVGEGVHACVYLRLALLLTRPILSICIAIANYVNDCAVL